MRKSFDKAYPVVLTLFILSILVSWRSYFKDYRQSDTVDIESFPMQIGDWVAEELPISEADYAILETRNAFTRKYTNPQGRGIYIFVVYSQSNRKISHPPEVCYTGSGVDVLENTRDSIPVPDANLMIYVNRLVLSKGTAKQLAFYWFKVGDIFTANYWKQQSLIALKTLLGQSASSALIRISSDVTAHDSVATVQVLKEFVELITPVLIGHLK